MGGFLPKPTSTELVNGDSAAGRKEILELRQKLRDVERSHAVMQSRLETELRRQEHAIEKHKLGERRLSCFLSNSPYFILGSRVSLTSYGLSFQLRRNSEKSCIGYVRQTSTSTKRTKLSVRSRGLNCCAIFRFPKDCIRWILPTRLAGGGDFRRKPRRP